jgi:hypothetical protein
MRLNELHKCFQTSSSTSKKKALQPSSGKQTTLFGANGLFNFSAKSGGDSKTGFKIYQDPEQVSKEPESPKDVQVQTTLSGVSDDGKCVSWTIARKNSFKF